MNVLETLQAAGDRLQVAWVVGSVPTDGSGDVRILHANAAAAALFGYASGRMMVAMDVRDLMPEEVATGHRAVVASYVERANGGSVTPSSIMGSWRHLHARRKDGTLVPVAANVADVRNSAERYLVALFIDRSAEVKREAELGAALEAADQARELADQMREEADAARRAAEDGLLRQRRLSGQITLLRQIFAGTIALVVMLGVLVVAQWATGVSDPDGLAMVERVLLVLTGILGSAMASVFDSRHRAD